MNTCRRHLQAFARSALLVMCALVLLPSLAQAWGSGAAQHAQAQVCTPQGMRLVALDDRGGAPHAIPGHGDHCPFCAQPGSLLAPPPAAQVFVLPAEDAAATPLVRQAPGTVHAWRGANPRGPPVRA